MPSWRQHVERLVIERGLGKPHAFGLAAEPPAKIGDAPAHLGALVAAACAAEGSRGGTAARWRCRGRAARGSCGRRRARARTSSGACALHPLEQRRPEVEADVLERVDDPRDAAVGREHARGDDGAITLLLDARVPVVIRRGGRPRARSPRATGSRAAADRSGRGLRRTRADAMRRDAASAARQRRLPARIGAHGIAECSGTDRPARAARRRGSWHSSGRRTPSPSRIAVSSRSHASA